MDQIRDQILGVVHQVADTLGITPQHAKEEPLQFAATIVLSVMTLLMIAYFTMSQGRFAPKNPQQTKQVELKEYTVEEVAKHNQEKDLWLIIQKQDEDRKGVYDLTDYLFDHPGGYAMMNNAGKDSTEGFYGPQHPPGAFELVDSFLIGYIKQ